MTRVAYIGNFRPAHSTENDYRRAFHALGVDVLPLQEDTITDAHLAHVLDDEDIDLLLYTRTWGLPGWWPELWDRARRRGIPKVAVHLDLWWGLDREYQVRDQAMFQCDLVLTADGGHQGQWEQAGVRHEWLTPGVSGEGIVEQPGRNRGRYAHDVVFVGSHPDRYHAQWTWRRQLFTALEREYGGRFVHYDHGSKMRGLRLADLYRSSKVVVGDSLMLGGQYWSDRAYETTGRGGILVHPWIPELAESLVVRDDSGSAVRFGPSSMRHPLFFYEVGSTQSLLNQVDAALSMSDEDRDAMRRQAQRLTLDRHTYAHRAAWILDRLKLDHDPVPTYGSTL